MRCPGYWMKLPDDKTSMHGHAVHWMHMCTWNMTGFAGQETLPPSAGRLPLRTWCSITRAAPGTVWFAARGISAGVLSRSYAVKGVSAAWGPRPPATPSCRSHHSQPRQTLHTRRRTREVQQSRLTLGLPPLTTHPPPPSSGKGPTRWQKSVWRCRGTETWVLGPWWVACQAARFGCGILEQLCRKSEQGWKPLTPGRWQHRRWVGPRSPLNGQGG